MSNFEQSGYRKLKAKNIPHLLRAWFNKRILVLLLLATWSAGLGWGTALAIAPTSPIAQAQPTVPPGSSAPASPNYQLGQKLYLENCSSCHTPIPPEVLPTETWKQILENPQNHYGTQLPTILGPVVLLMWDYLRTFSRPVNPEETVPTLVAQSRYFKALHPRVELPEFVNYKTCITCHPGANQLDYRSLTSEWEDAS